MFYPPDSIEAESKAKWVVDYIISHGRVALPQLRKLKINGEWMACISTFISDGRTYARSNGFEILCDKNIHNWRVHPEYYASPITTNA